MSASVITFANLGKKRNLKTADIAPVLDELRGHGDLAQVICQLHAGFDLKNTASAMPEPIRYLLRAYELLRGRALARRTTERLFDFFARYRLKPAALAFFHGGYFLPKTLAKARAQGAITVDIAVSAHLAANAGLEQQEFGRLGLAYTGVYMRLAEEAPHLNEFEYVITMSDFAKQTYIDAGYPKERLFVAIPDIDSKRFAPSGTSPQKFRVLYMAHTQPLKGLHYLLDAWESFAFPDAELVIVGGFSEMPEELKLRYLERMHADSRITWVLGTHTPEQYYHDASVVVLPSLTEGFGRVTLEAMACGLPVITTEHARGLVEDGKTGFIVPVRDAAAIREKLEYLHQHPELAKGMGREARAAVEAKKPFGTAVYEIYQEILRREGKA